MNSGKYSRVNRMGRLPLSSIQLRASSGRLEIQQIDVTADVDYGSGRTARFTDQLLAGPMSQGGDSGSAVLDDGNRLVGLLFAGSDSTTIINHIEHVFAALNISR